jgi:hypothetical protein
MNAVAAKISATVVYSDVPWGNIFAGLIAGEYDVIIAAVSITPSRDEVMDFTLPYVTIGDNYGIVVQQGNDALRRQINEALWQLRTEGTLATIIAGIAADKRPEWEKPRLPVWPEVPPDAASTIVYTNTKQCSTLIQVPLGAVTDTTVLAYTLTNIPTIPSGFAWAGHAFELDAYQNGDWLSGFTFKAPVTVTLHYTDTDVVGLNKESLRLYYWDKEESKWADAAATCSPPSTYDRHLQENWLAVPICHLTRLALFGVTPVYLPLILHN